MSVGIDTDPVPSGETANLSRTYQDIPGHYGLVYLVLLSSTYVAKIGHVVLRMSKKMDIWTAFDSIYTRKNVGTIIAGDMVAPLVH